MFRIQTNGKIWRLIEECSGLVLGYRMTKAEILALTYEYRRTDGSYLVKSYMIGERKVHIER